MKENGKQNKTKPIPFFLCQLLHSLRYPPDYPFSVFILLLSSFFYGPKTKFQSRINGLYKNFTCVLLLAKPPNLFFQINFPLPHIALNSYLSYEIPLCSSCIAGVSLKCPLSSTTFQAKLAGQTNSYNHCLMFLFFLLAFFPMVKMKCLVPISSVLGVF